MELKGKFDIGKIIKSVILALGGIVMVLPLAWMISSSFKFESDVFKVPIEWIPSRINLSNYKTAFTDFPYLNWYINTIVSTLAIVVLLLIVSSCAGYAFAKLEFKGKDLIFFLFISTMMIPMQVRIIPQFMMFKELGMINNLASIVLPWSYNAFSIFLMRQFFVSIPDELLEAARIDGCNEYVTFFRIVLPLAKSQLAALGILSFTWGWNQYFAPLIYIQNPKMQVLSVGIASFKAQYADNYAVQMAGATLALIPVIIVYLLAQKQLIEGIASSGIKG